MFGQCGINDNNNYVLIPQKIKFPYWNNKNRKIINIFCGHNTSFVLLGFYFILFYFILFYFILFFK